MVSQGEGRGDIQIPSLGMKMGQLGKKLGW